MIHLSGWHRRELVLLYLFDVDNWNCLQSSLSREVAQDDLCCVALDEEPREDDTVDGPNGDRFRIPYESLLGIQNRFDQKRIGVIFSQRYKIRTRAFSV